MLTDEAIYKKILNEYRPSGPTYEHGLPFTKELALNLYDQYIRVKKQGKASLIIIDGGVGEGKTTKGTHIVDFINWLDGKPEMDIKEKRQYGMGGEDFLKKLRFCYEDKMPVCVYDEAGDFGKRQALTKFNAMLNRTFETFRAFKIIVVIILPSFAVLDNDIFDKGIPRMLIHTHDREKYGNFKVFDHVSMMYIRHQMKKEVVKRKVYHYFTPNIHGHFLNLSDARVRTLDGVSTEGKLEELKASEIKIQGLVGFNEIATRMGKSLVWAREAIKELKIKPVRVINRRKYYDESILNILTDFTLTAKK